MPVVPAPETVTSARFTPLAGPDRGNAVSVHFNPASLQYTIANTQDPQSKGNSVQFVSQSTAKLTMDLVFDTTLTGVDVREATEKMVNLMRPYQRGNGKVPPRVEFAWGVYTFEGVVEQYKETLDFFSASGVPLRASINLTLSKMARVFASSSKNPASAVDREITPDPVVVPNRVDPSSMATAMGDPRAARAIATQSGSASLRFGAGAPSIAGSVTLSPSSAISAGGGPGIGRRVGVGEGASLGVAASAGAAFAGLRAGTREAADPVALDLHALQPPPASPSGAGTEIGLGGIARATAGGSLSADVGISISDDHG